MEKIIHPTKKASTVEALAVILSDYYLAATQCNSGMEKYKKLWERKNSLYMEVRELIDQLEGGGIKKKQFADEVIKAVKSEQFFDQQAPGGQP